MRFHDAARCCSIKGRGVWVCYSTVQGTPWASLGSIWDIANPQTISRNLINQSCSICFSDDEKNYPFHCFKLNHDMLQDKTARYLSVIMEIVTGSPLAL